jgi:nicotinamide-nucleotide amidase
MKACIISIGEELLIGQTVNTNAAWIASRLNELGIETKEIVVITDKHEEILRSLKACGERSDIVLITGGLGPTRDDVTKHALCEFFKSKLVMDQQILDDVTKYFKKFGRQITDLNREQALVPEKAKALRNPYGTAPGLWFREKGKSFIAMPGVPYEMKEMINSHIYPVLAEMPRQQYIIHKSILTHGIGESALADKLSGWEDELPDFIQLAYLPSMGIVKLRLTAKGKQEDQLEKALADEVSRLQKLIPEYIWGYDNDTQEIATGKHLKRTGSFLATAESCTGGYLAHSITRIPGSSAYFKGSIIAYSNASKEQLLSVSPDILKKHGAVSSQVAEAMASGVKKLFDTDYSVGITGIAGPDGGTKEKPVGTTFIAVAGKEELVCNKYTFADNRERNIMRAARSAFAMLTKMIEKEQPKRS